MPPPTGWSDGRRPGTMRKALVLILVGAFAWWVVSRRGERAERVVVGYDDGSSLEVARGSAAWSGALALAREALRS